MFGAEMLFSRTCVTDTIPLKTAPALYVFLALTARLAPLHRTRHSSLPNILCPQLGRAGPDPLHRYKRLNRLLAGRICECDFRRILSKSGIKYLGSRGGKLRRRYEGDGDDGPDGANFMIGHDPALATEPRAEPIRALSTRALSPYPCPAIEHDVQRKRIRLVNLKSGIAPGGNTAGNSLGTTPASTACSYTGRWRSDHNPPERWSVRDQAPVRLS